MNIDWSFLGSKNSPFITIVLKNKSTDIQDENSINLEFFTNEKLIPVKKVSGFDTNEDCKTQPCKIKELQIPIQMVLKPKSIFRINYDLKDYVNLSPEKGEIVISLSTNIENRERTIERKMTLSKYIRSYNCIFGKGHPFKKVQ